MPLPRRLRAFTATLLAVALAPTWAAPDAPMTIHVESRTVADNIIEAPTTLYMEGVIEEATPHMLRSVLKGLNAQWITVFFNSPGGNMLAGMEIGRILRKEQATVYIGARGEGRTPKRGVCLSACSLAFLGGAFRYAAPDSIYGVHRAFRSSGATAADLDVGQVIAAASSTYMREMGVDPGLLDLTVKAGKNGMYVLSRDELKALRVVNDGRKEPTWTIEVVDQGTYLKGSQETVWGTGNIRFMCIGSKLQMISDYTAGDKAASIAKGRWVHSMFLDNDTLPLPTPAQLWAEGGSIRAFIVIAPEHMRGLQTASKVGHAMQVNRDAPTFVGYTVDIDEASKKRVSTFSRNCLR
jgi:hypothetical protein